MARKGKIHFGFYFDAIDRIITFSICSTRGTKIKATTILSDVTCKNCLRVIESELEIAKDRAYPDRIRNKKTGTVLKIRKRSTYRRTSGREKTKGLKRMSGKAITDRKKKEGE